MCSGKSAHGEVLRRRLQQRGRGALQLRPSLHRVEAEGGGEVPVMLLGFNGTSDESNLALLQTDELEATMIGGRVRWLAAGEALSLEGETYLGSGTWRWLMYLLLVLLLVEMSMLASRKHEEETATGGIAA